MPKSRNGKPQNDVCLLTVFIALQSSHHHPQCLRRFRGGADLNKAMLVNRSKRTHQTNKRRSGLTTTSAPAVTAISAASAGCVQNPAAEKSPTVPRASGAQAAPPAQHDTARPPS